MLAGGTPYQQQQVRQALAASAFDWSVVPATITITIGKGQVSEATSGQISLSGSLLNAGRFSWGVVQHEYAHQVDFLLFNDATRASLTSLSGPATGASSCRSCVTTCTAASASHRRSPGRLAGPRELHAADLSDGRIGGDGACSIPRPDGARVDRPQPPLLARAVRR